MVHILHIFGAFLLTAGVNNGANEHAFEVLQTGNVEYAGESFFAIEATLSSLQSASENWCRDYQHLCASYGLRPTGCGEKSIENGGDYDVCRTEYNSDPYINNVFSCPPNVRMAEAASTAFSVIASSERTFGFYRCRSDTCEKDISLSQESLRKISGALNDRHVFTLCSGTYSGATTIPTTTASTPWTVAVAERRATTSTNTTVQHNNNISTVTPNPTDINTTVQHSSNISTVTPNPTDINTTVKQNSDVSTVTTTSAGISTTVQHNSSVSTVTTTWSTATTPLGSSNTSSVTTGTFDVTTTKAIASTITIEGLYNLVMEEVGLDFLTFTWNVTANFTVHSYRVRYSVLGGSYKDLAPPPAAHETRASLRGLMPATPYQIRVTSYGEDGGLTSEVSTIQATDNIVVHVSCDQSHMEVSFPLAALPGVDVAGMHLINASCLATRNDTHATLRTGLQDCGTIQEVYGHDKFTFTNTAIADPIVDVNGVVRGQPFSRSFTCTLVSVFDVTFTDGEILYVVPDSIEIIQPETRFLETVDGLAVYPPLYANNLLNSVPIKFAIDVEDANSTFVFDMHLYTSQDFVHSYEPLDYPLQVLPSDRLYFGLSSRTALSNMELFALDCLATPTVDMSAEPKVYIIRNGCKIDPTLKIHSDPSDPMTLQFSIMSFTFPNSTDNVVYLHCSMMLCMIDDRNSRCAQGCIQEQPDQRRRRRGASWQNPDVGTCESCHQHQTASISQGPLILLPGYTAKERTALAMPISLGVVAGIAAVLLVAVVALTVQYRRALAAR
ncbi:PREDICTED: uncharacterized protein LOC109487589 [Branchiostoma belcheri]|uniref:Uncharacterized protein LOC109487589 n=1 Tax=Branchiostoma belcheri TaxID=7741 RepID=A0A6P5ALV1_BRABE|nr:PREDICTED: uncharacterized protein LOC109487589 [Branchiostoma belcheri]